MAERAAGGWVDVGGSRVRLLRDGAVALPAMLEAIAGARQEVVAEFYWWATDRTGVRFRDALVQRARDGVAVRVIYDSVGSLWMDDSFWEPLRDAGGQSLEFHPISPASGRFQLDRLFLRDHRKLLVVDQRVGFTGGVNLADPWAPEEWGGSHWRDDAIEVEGAAAEELRIVFYETWKRCEQPGPDPGRLPWLPAGDAFVLANHSALGSRRQIRKFYTSKLTRARQQVDLANAYFVPDRRVRRELVRAVERGVQVRILIPQQADLPIVQLAMDYAAASLMRRGVQFWAYPDRMMHSKLAVIDGSFVTIGSYNLDHLSWRYNLECNLAVIDEVFAREVRCCFEDDLARSIPLEADSLMSSAWRRGLGWAAYQLRAAL
jgi:cardiolipin synthase